MTEPGEQGKGSEGSAGSEDQEAAALQKTVEELRQKLEAAQTARAGDQQKLSDVGKELLSEDYLEFLAEKGQKKEVSVDGEPDWDTLSPREMVAHLQSRQKELMDGSEKASEERFQALVDGVSKTIASMDLDICGIRHPDFREQWSEDTYKKRFFSIAEENPKWGAERVRRQLEAELALEEKEEKVVKESKAKEEAALIGERGGISPSLLQGKELTEKEASEMAWRATMKNQEHTG